MPAILQLLGVLIDRGAFPLSHLCILHASEQSLVELEGWMDVVVSELRSSKLFGPILWADWCDFPAVFLTNGQRGVVTQMQNCFRSGFLYFFSLPPLS